MARLLTIKNHATGEERVIDTYLARSRRLAQGFLNRTRGVKGLFKHIVLTQGVESYHPRIINDFMNKIRRYYGDIQCFWTIEVQEERYEKYGERVIHWHIMMFFPDLRQVEFGRMDIFRIQSYWKYGNERNSVNISPVYKPRLDYLLKYVTKSLDVDIESEYKLHRVGSSRIEGFWRQSWSRLTSALERYGDVLKTLFWDRRGAFGYAYEDGIAGRKKLYVYQHPPSGWYLVKEAYT